MRLQIGSHLYYNYTFFTRQLYDCAVCLQHKKLESCIMKDIRDRYTAEEFSEDNIVASERSMRSPQYLEDDTIEQTVFDYIYGDKSIDLDVLL